MATIITLDEDLLRRLPLPLAQLYRRAHNAKTPQERHHTAYYLWEAGLKLLGAVAVVEYAELSDQDPELAERLQNLARPALGHWWEFVRRLTPILADRGDRGFAQVRELLLGRSRDDLPHAAGLDAVLMQALEASATPTARTSVRLTELFDRLVRYRNREFGHGAVGQRTAAFYERMGRALLAGVPEVLARLDPLAGRRLLYVADVRRQAAGRWLVERFELRGEAPRRLESLDLPDSELMRQLLPERLYLEALATDVSAATAGKKEGLESSAGKVAALHPLVVFDADTSDTLFLNARRGRQRIGYLSYSTGIEREQQELASEQRELLARVLHVPVDPPSASAWSERSQAEEQSAGGMVEAAPLPRRLGEFELLSELGRGGMGVVYRAWQPSLGRQVAVKSLYRTGDPKAEARFAREIRALGHVEHPHVVKIFVSGSDGEQWFYAMELVEGATLAAVCEKLQSGNTRPDALDAPTWIAAVSTACAEARQAEKPLSAGGNDQLASLGAPAHAEPEYTHSPLRPGQSYVCQAVELVKQVSEAAHALHERGILHRDIKPGNIMVTADGQQAALMDLGLAQIADEVEGRLTRTRQFIGTLRYASPEQVLAVGGLDRRSDVYSLGATLWELLTLRPMFGATEQTPTPELMRRIQVAEPEHPRKYHPRLPRDLEAIALRCLEKDPQRRYATARDLARDLERYQAGEPVQARPISGLQRSWRWCRRNPVVAGMLILLALVIVGSLAGLSVLYVHAERHRSLAEQREAGMRAVTAFYQDHVLAAARPKGWGGGAGTGVTLKEALDQAVPKIAEDFAGQPELEATVCNTLGMTYWYLGHYEAANPLLEKASQTRQDILGPDHPDTLRSLHNLARLRWRQDKLTEAITLSRQALPKQQLVLGPEHPDTLWTQLYLGLFLLEDGHNDEAETLLSEAIAICRRTLGEEHVQTLFGQNDLAIVLNNKGKYQEAAELDRKTLAGRTRTLGPEHPDTLRSVANLAYSLWNLGNLEEAEALEHKALAARKRVLGEGHTETYWSRRNLADILADRGKLTEAEAMWRDTCKILKELRGPDDAVTLEAFTRTGQFLRGQNKYEEANHFFQYAVEGSRRQFGPEAPLTLSRQGQLAWLLELQNRLPEAEALYRRTLDAQRRVRGPAHSDTLTTQNNLALFLLDMGKYAETETLFRQLCDIRQQLSGPEHPDTLFYQANLAYVLMRQWSLDEAEKLYRHVWETRLRLYGAKDSATIGSLRGLASLLQTRCGFSEAESLFRQAVELNSQLYNPEHQYTLATRSQLAEILVAEGRFDDAEKEYRHILSVSRRTLPAEHNDTIAILRQLAKLRKKQRDFAEAEQLLREALASNQRKFGLEHHAVFGTQTELADLLEESKNLDEAEKLYRQVLASHQRVEGPDHPDTLAALEDLARYLGEHNQPAEAEKLYRQLLKARRSLLPAGHPDLAAELTGLGDLLTRTGRAKEAEPLLREGLAIREKKLPAKSWLTANARSFLGHCLAQQQRFAEAEPLLLAGYEGLSRATDTPAKWLARSLDRVIELYERWDRPEQAAEWRKKRPAEGE